MAWGPPLKEEPLSLIDFITKHSVRGECKCGQCIDRGDKPDPVGHTADLIFFKVAAKDDPDPNRLKTLVASFTSDFSDLNPFDGVEHGYMEIGAWLGSQDLALRFMGLSSILGVANLLTPKTVLKLDGDLAMKMAKQGLVVIQAVHSKKK